MAPRPSGLYIDVSARFTIEELTAVMSPNQVLTFLRGIGAVISAAKGKPDA